MVSVAVRDVARGMIDKGALSIRDVDAGEEAFLYASGNWGPGYVMVKGLVTEGMLFRYAVSLLANKIREVTDGRYQAVAGNVTGGMIPGWLLAESLDVPFMYIRDLRKKGGHKELITGDLQGKCKGNWIIPTEELVNFAETMVNSAIELRNSGYQVAYGATILTYNNPSALKALKEVEVEMIYLLTLEELLEVAEEKFPSKVVNQYRDFLKDPLGWQEKRGLKPVKEGGTK
jgi:orotate phosphoribosyltransferase